jgi:molybdopterin biosynthesis enzyme
VDHGGLVAEPLERSASHMLSDFARAELLLIVPSGAAELPAGTAVEAVRLAR